MQSKCKFTTSELNFHVGLCYFRRPAHQISTASPLRQFEQGKNIGPVLLKCSLFPLLSVLLPSSFHIFLFIFICMHSGTGTLRFRLLRRERLHSPTTNNTRWDICCCSFASNRHAVSVCAGFCQGQRDTKAFAEECCSPYRWQGCSGAEGCAASWSNAAVRPLSRMNERHKAAKASGGHTSDETKLVAEMWDLECWAALIKFNMMMGWRRSPHSVSVKHLLLDTDNELVSCWCGRMWWTWVPLRTAALVG